MEKAIQGEHFENLDMVTSLLSKFPKQQENLNEEEKKEIVKIAHDQNRPLIEVISSTENEGEDEEMFQQATIEDMEVNLIKNFTYGFNNLYADVFKYRKEEMWEFAEFDPEEVPLEEREATRTQLETEKFDDERYVENLFGESKNEITEICEQEFPYKHNEIEEVTKKLEDMKIEDDFLSNEDKEELLKLRNREYLIDKTSPNWMFQWIDILYAYLYDFRVNMFSDNWESSWNISKLAATISWFADFKNQNEQQLLTTIYRRALTYPLYRSFNLWEKIREDLQTILSIGRKAIVKWFIKIKKLNEKKESGYLINRIFINDFIVWIQQTPESNFRLTLEEISALKISKADLNLNLIQIEEFAKDWY